jgi:hypothetical protein
MCDRCQHVGSVLLNYFIPPSSFRQLCAYRLGHFEFKTLFLLRSYYKNAYR